MNFRRAVGTVRANDSEMGHTHLARRFILDKTHAADYLFVSRIAVSDIVEEATIDLVNNFQMAWNERLEQLDGPFLQRLGKQRMIGVSQRALGKIPGLIPAELGLVEQYPHQFRDCEGRVSVVELDRRVIRQG